MARSHSKLSVRRAQPAHKTVSPVTTRKTNPNSSISHLPQVKGKTLEEMEFISAPDYHGISLGFKDKTFLDLKIETSFTVKADYLDQKTSRHRLLRKVRKGRR